MNSLSISKRSLAIAFIAAFAMAFILAMGMATPAHAAQKKPYAGYQIEKEYPVYDAQGVEIDSVKYMAKRGAGSIVMENVGDTRKVKAGFLNAANSFTVWSGNVYKDHLTAFNGGKMRNDDGSYTNDYLTIVDNTKYFKTIKGMKYNKKKNTLTLKNVKAPAYTLVVKGMGSNFKIVLKGKNQLAGIRIEAIEKTSAFQYTEDGVTDWTTTESGFYPSCVTIDGAGSLAINKKTYNASAVTIDGGGVFTSKSWDGNSMKYTYSTAYTKSKLTITKKPKVQIYAYGASPTVSANWCATKSPVTIKGLAKSDIQSMTEKVPARNEYEESHFHVLKSATDTDYDAARTEDNAIKLNNGAFYGVVADNSPWYLDTKTRQQYYCKWDIYQTVINYDGCDYAYFIGQVGNTKNYPKGYTPVVETAYKSYYKYVINNSKLIAGSTA